ncbi:MAG: hypothetical protein R3F13_21795 [Prosthecobacter sp.]
MRHASKRLLAVVMMISIGAPWAVLQSVAWVGMSVAYSVRVGSVVEGVAQTFDGRHPCALCQTVAEGTRTENGKKDAIPLPDATKLILTTFVAESLLTPPNALRHDFAPPPHCRAPENPGKPGLRPPRTHA